MVSDITGIIKKRENQSITLDVGCMSFAVQVANSSAFYAGSDTKITVHTHLHWHQENGPTLYGFVTELDRTVFLLIISCSGIGPKIALAILDGLGAQLFLNAIQTGNEGALSKVSGIGAKKGEQLIMQLKYKVAQLLKSGIDLGDVGSAAQWHNIAEVLTTLGYSSSEVSRVLKHLNDTYVQENLPFDKLMRHALAFLSKHT